MKNDDRIDLRVPAEEKALFYRAAELEGMPVSIWIRRVCRAAAAKLEADEKKRRR